MAPATDDQSVEDYGRFIFARLRRLTLPAKILLLGLANVLVLAGAALLFLRLQLGSGTESMLLGPASDKMMGIAARLTRDLDHTPREEWDALLENLQDEYQATAYLIEPSGTPLAGSRAPLPDAVHARIRIRRPFGPPPPSRARKKGPPRQSPPPVFLATTDNPVRYWIGARIPIRETGGAVLILETDSMFNPALFFDPGLMLSVGAVAAALSVACWFLFVRNLTRSIRRMGVATERIAAGAFEALAPMDRHDELGHLGAQINRMAGQLYNLVSGQKRFLGDVAHELRAPLARMQKALSALESRSTGGQSAMADLREEVQQMSELVNELLHFSTSSIQPVLLPVTPLQVAETVQRAIEREQVPGARIEVSVDERLRVLANEACITRSLSNLLRNSLRHAGHAGPVEIAARPEGSDVVITVTDAGPGVLEDELDRILEPTYRPGGDGLGLVIVKAGIESCQGTVTCRNLQPHGLEVSVRLPAAGDS